MAGLSQRAGVGGLPLFVSWFAGMLVTLQKGVSQLSVTHCISQLLHAATCAGRLEGQINNCCVPSGMSRHTDLNIWPK